MKPCSNCLFFGRVRPATVVRTFVPPTRIKDEEKRNQYLEKTEDHWAVCNECNTELDSLYDSSFQRYYNRFMKCKVLRREFGN